MNPVFVGNVSEFPVGSKKIIEANGRSIGVYNVNGHFYAIRNICPHQGGPLCEGNTVTLVSSEGPGQFCFEREGEIIRCPWHQWEFDIKTGGMLVDPKMRSKTYDVTVERYDTSVEQGQIYVHC